jgi:predicted RNase H-like HicB family nuclease
MKLELQQAKAKCVALGKTYDQATEQLKELREKQVTAELSIIRANFKIIQRQQQQQQKNEQQNSNSSCTMM